MKIIVTGKLQYIYAFTRRNPKYPNTICITECTIEVDGRTEKIKDTSIECSTATLKENILKLIELQGKEVRFECEYVLFDNNYQLIKVL